MTQNNMPMNKGPSNAERPNGPLDVEEDSSACLRGWLLACLLLLDGFIMRLQVVVTEFAWLVD
jgi:hypothetical protein